MDNLIGFLATRLSLIQRYFHDYTDHGIGHSKRVLRNFCSVVEKRGIDPEMDRNQALVGICACLVHDIGMGPVYPEEVAEASSPDFQVDLEWRDTEVRRKHHERTEWWIKHSEEFADKLGWFPDALKPVLASVAKGHRKTAIHMDPVLQDKPDYQFLSALLRLADQMDLSEDRVTFLGTSRESLPTGDETQTREFAKSLCRAKVSLQDKDDALVLKSTQPLDSKILLMLDAFDDLVHDIEQTIEETKIYYWNGRAVLPTKLKYDFHVEGEELSSEHHLKADYENVFRYLSSTIYEGQDLMEVPFREAVSNAIDACVLQAAADEDSDCHISVAHLGDEILIWDNGCGMSPRVIEHHLKVLGSRYYHSPWFRGRLTSIGRESVPHIGIYGIGIFSYALISDEFEIISSTETDAPRRVFFSPPFGITIGPLDQRDMDRGTIVVLKKAQSKQSKWPSSGQLGEIIEKWFPWPPVPIYILCEEGCIELHREDGATQYCVHSDETETIVRYVQTLKHEDEYSVESCLILDLHLKTADSQDGQISPTGDRIIQVRGVRVPVSRGIYSPFANTLLSLQEHLEPLVRKAEMRILKGQTLFVADLDGEDIMPNIQRSALRETKQMAQALNLIEGFNDIMAALACTRILLDDGLPAFLKKQIQSTVFRFMSRPTGNYSLYNKIPGLKEALMKTAVFYDWEAGSTVTYEEVKEVANEHTICIAPIDMVLRNDKGYSTRVACLLHPLKMLRYRNKRKVLFAEVSENLVKWLGSRVSSPKILFSFHGEAGMIGSLNFLKWILAGLGHEDWIVNDNNPYHLKKGGYTTGESRRSLFY